MANQTGKKIHAFNLSWLATVNMVWFRKSDANGNFAVVVTAKKGNVRNEGNVNYLVTANDFRYNFLNPFFPDIPF